MKSFDPSSEKVLNLRTTASHKCAAVSRRARILRLIDFVHHSTLGLRVIQKEEEERRWKGPEYVSVRNHLTLNT